MRIVLTAIVMSTTLAGEATPEPAPPVEPATPLPTAALTQSTLDLDGNESERVMVGQVVSRYQEAGLAMPPVTVTFHSGRQACAGHTGMVGHATDRSIIDLCVSVLSDEETRSVVAHELAHAWLFHNINEGDRFAFLEVHKLKSWHSPDLRWFEQGTEWAAETIAETVFPDLPRILPNVADERQLLTEGFQVLTGRSLSTNRRSGAIMELHS